MLTTILSSSQLKGRYLANHLLSPDAVAPGDYRLGDRRWITSVVTGSDRANSSIFLRCHHQMLEEQYPSENGQILLAFPRLFIVARRTE